MPQDSAVRGLHPGQHALVSLTWYGLRLPGEAIWGYHRWGYRVPTLGETVVFTLPASQAASTAASLRSVGICQALPGDTIWIDPVRRLILPARTSPDAQVLVVPQKHVPIAITPHNARLFAYLMNRYENSQTQVDGQGRFLLDGVPVRMVRFNRDYYWIETRPESYVLIPHDALVGKVVHAFRRKR